MHSPLPDSSALEAGILEDTHPTSSSRLSLVQDNVRNLLRMSTSGHSVFSSPPRPATPPAAALRQADLPPMPPETPTHAPLHVRTDGRPEVLPSPTDSLPSTASPTSTVSSSASLTSRHDADVEAGTGGLFPPPNYLKRMSAFLSGRPVAALDHPDVSDASLSDELGRRKAESRQKRAWKRQRVEAGSRSERSGKSRRSGSGGSQCLLCVVMALMLASVVATYLILATASTTDTTPTFHILFILGIILATIVFAHTLIRLLLFSGSFRHSGRQVLILPTTRPRHHRRQHHARRGDSMAVQQVRAMPSLSTDSADFVPATPIRVQVGTENEVRPDPRNAVPTATAIPAEGLEAWDKAPSPIANPPPAYGRWRGSVRANPELLHWQAIPSPIDDDAQELPSPTYEEAMLAQRTGPPSYVTRESPARTAGREVVRGSVVGREREVEPEMIEVVGTAGESVGMAK